MRHDRRLDHDERALEHLCSRLPLFFLSKARAIARRFPFRIRDAFQLPLLRFGLVAMRLTDFRGARGGNSSLTVYFLVERFRAGGDVVRLRRATFGTFSIAGSVRRRVYVPVEDPRGGDNEMLCVGFLVFFVVGRVYGHDQALIAL